MTMTLTTNNSSLRITRPATPEAAPLPIAHHTHAPQSPISDHRSISNPSTQLALHLAWQAIWQAQ